jgi:hypothetical protein
MGLKSTLRRTAHYVSVFVVFVSAVALAGHQNGYSMHLNLKPRADMPYFTNLVVLHQERAESPIVVVQAPDFTARLEGEVSASGNQPRPIATIAVKPGAATTVALQPVKAQPEKGMAKLPMQVAANDGIQRVDGRLPTGGWGHAPPDWFVNIQANAAYPLSSLRK